MLASYWHTELLRFGLVLGLNGVVLALRNGLGQSGILADKLIWFVHAPFDQWSDPHGDRVDGVCSHL